jgi:hypothetical protein
VGSGGRPWPPPVHAPDPPLRRRRPGGWPERRGGLGGGRGRAGCTVAILLPGRVTSLVLSPERALRGASAVEWLAEAVRVVADERLPSPLEEAVPIRIGRAAAPPDGATVLTEARASALLAAHETDLLTTLRCFLRHHGSMTETAEAMRLHRHTVGYGLSRVLEVSDLSHAESSSGARRGPAGRSPTPQPAQRPAQPPRRVALSGGRARGLPLPAGGKASGATRRHHAGAVGMAASRALALGEHQHVLAERRQVLPAQRAPIRRRLAVLRPAHLPPPGSGMLRHVSRIAPPTPRGCFAMSRGSHPHPDVSYGAGMEQRAERIVAETSRYRITGFVSLPRDGYRSRLTDYLNAGERAFLALTDVELAPLEEPQTIERYPFLALAIGQIVFARTLEPSSGP